MKSSIKIILLVLVLMSSCNQSKIGYVDINKLYESFIYKKNLTQEYNKVKVARQRILDSLERELGGYMALLETNNGNAGIETDFNKKRDNFLQLEKQYEEDNQVLVDSYNDKIMKQLNAYIKEYGKNHNYDLIVGADSKGSILYGNQSLDVTDAMAQFVNDRFKGDKL